MPSTFQAVETAEEYLIECERFLNGQTGPVPVWVGARPDLLESVELAEPLYRGKVEPDRADYGLWLGPGGGPEQKLVQPLARRWLGYEESVALETPARLLVAGLYENLDWRQVRSLLLHSYISPDLSLGFISGRDAHSLAWHAARQWAAIDPGLTATAFLSAVDRPEPANDVLVLGEDEFDNQDIQQIVLEGKWRKILFQGHGKDDSINLGDFTICGLNPAVAARPGGLFPRCGYGWPCYKPEDKLIPLRQVRAAEVVLSACNSGPMAEMALYDPKYVLLLNALDGCAQTVISAVSVHDSDQPENRLWLDRAGLSAQSSLAALNWSLRRRHPYPAFWQFGLPPASLSAYETTKEEPEPSPELNQVFARLHSYLLTELLPPNYGLRRRLEKLNHKVNQFLSRPARYEEAAQGGLRGKSLRSDLQSLDLALAERILANPEDDIMNYGAYFGERSKLDPASVVDYACSCGFPAQKFVRQGLTAATLNTTCVFCLRCGDKIFRLDGAPLIDCQAANRLEVSGTFRLQVELALQENGPVQVGLFVPSYMRSGTRSSSGLQRIKGAAGSLHHLSFDLSFDPDLPPQAYYFTVYAVQNLGLSTYRQHFSLEKL